MKPNPRRLDRDAYPEHFDLPARFSDVDSQGHLNNVRLMEYYQEGRILFHHALRDEFDFEGDSRVLVAHHSVDYLREVHYPGTITIGVGLLRIGSSSYTLGCGLFQNGRCAGLATAVMVNAGKSGTAPLPAALVTVLKKKLLPEEAL